MNQLRARIAVLLEQIPSDFGGGCSVSKANPMAWLISRYNLKTTLDIGVYRGRSLFPQALAHQQSTGGTVYGVDPWSRAEARENDHLELKDAINAFIDHVDFERIYADVNVLRGRLSLQSHCILLRQTSARAIEYFAKRNVYFDLIHIDGNHDTEHVMQDVNLYLPRLNLDGFLITDDISWNSVRPAYKAASLQLSLICEKVDSQNDYAIFWNNCSLLRSLVRSAVIKYVGRNER
jgi:hypothetical protein